MKLLRFGPAGQEKPGLLDTDGQIRDLSDHVRDIDFADSSLLDCIASIEPSSLPIVAGPVRLGPPVANVGKFIAIGVNYRDHAAEAGREIPSEPVVFMKATSCIVGPDDGILLPRGSVKTDWEVELGFVIGKRASYVAEADALDHIAGYLAVNDVSEREYQLERNGTWVKGKGCDTFGPIGPWLVTSDEIGDPQDLKIWLEVNGRRMQNGMTSDMIFPCAHILSYVSQFMTLLPGDIVTTGTPAGVGMGMKPQVFLKAGDTVRLGVERLGEQQQVVRE